MTAIEAVQVVPLEQTPDGTIRITGTRVRLDSLLYLYKQGESPEEITRRFPAVPLVQVYAAITYYLSHQKEIDDYLRRQEEEADALQQQMESDPQYHATMQALDERIRQRWAERQGDGQQ
jgi:uncharacterized protein (DUF433 family)